MAFSINGGPATNLDVVDDAGGDDIATTKVITDVTPENDGTIHLDFTNSEAFLNVVEILPGTPHRMLPSGLWSATHPTATPTVISGPRTGISPADALVAMLVIYPSSLMGGYTNGIALGTSITRCLSSRVASTL